MFDFDKKVDRRHNYSYKYDCSNDCLPMWVADMDFDTADGIKNSLLKRVNEGALGYTYPPKSLFESYISFWKRRHNVEYKKEWMIFSIGVVASISSIVRKMTNINENVIVLSPVYNIFYNSIINNHRNVLASNLIYDKGKYRINFDDLEEKMANANTTLMIFCNPHNPIGKIWTKDELSKIGKMAKKHNVLVISDEIHCDIVDSTYSYVPYLNVSEECKMNSITLISPSKCFNMTGIKSSMIVCANDEIKKKVERGLNTDECAEGNVFAYSSTIAAFNDCETWLDEVNLYIEENKKIFKDLIQKEIPSLKIVNSHATYLLWIDASSLTNDTTNLCNFLKDKAKIWVSAGKAFGDNGKAFFRINLATQRENIIEAVKRLKYGIEEYKKVR